MKNLTIAISGINATDNPGPGVGVARSIKELNPDLKLIGISYDPHDPGNYMDHLFENSFLFPYPSKGWEGMKESILEIKEKHGLDIIIPCLDAEIPLLIKHKNELLSLGIKLLLPNKDQFDLRSKDKLIELTEELGILHPRTVVISSIEELVVVLTTTISLPALVKGKYYKAYTVYNIESAILKASEIAAEWGFPLLVQEKIEGQEFNLIGLSDESGKLLGHVSIKKQLTTQLGKVWTAVTIKDESLDNLCKVFCEKTNWKGPFELECMVNPNGIYLIEINPRFPAWVYFATSVGINLPDMLIKSILKKPVNPHFDYPLGKYLVRFSSEFVCDLNNFHNLLSTNNRKGL